VRSVKIWTLTDRYGPVEPEACTTHGPGLAGTQAGVPSYFYIQARDEFGNNRTVPADCR
jgi:hypothetical protein